jgi:hypothetical protein
MVTSFTAVTGADTMTAKRVLGGALERGLGLEEAVSFHFQQALFPCAHSVPFAKVEGKGGGGGRAGVRVSYELQSVLAHLSLVARRTGEGKIQEKIR